nr:MAG TPA: hypothetical protein [Caudoviricetes sp.]
MDSSYSLLIRMPTIYVIIAITNILLIRFNS